MGLDPTHLRQRKQKQISHSEAPSFANGIRAISRSQEL
jgi:hypothetical protein